MLILPSAIKAIVAREAFAKGSDADLEMRRRLPPVAVPQKAISNSSRPGDTSGSNCWTTRANSPLPMTRRTPPRTCDHRSACSWPPTRSPNIIRVSSSTSMTTCPSSRPYVADLLHARSKPCAARIRRRERRCVVLGLRGRAVARRHWREPRFRGPDLPGLTRRIARTDSVISYSSRVPRPGRQEHRHRADVGSREARLAPRVRGWITPAT